MTGGRWPHANTATRQEGLGLFLNRVELRARVKVVSQTEPVSGPRGDVFPLTIRIIYTDLNGKQQEWRRSFYWSPTDRNISNAAAVPQGAWQTLEELELRDQAAKSNSGKTGGQRKDYLNFVLKGTVKGPEGDTTVGQDVSVINAIEIYGIGTSFQSWRSLRPESFAKAGGRSSAVQVRPPSGLCCTWVP